MPEGHRHRGRSLAQEAAALGPWFHNLHLPDGSQTQPHHPFGDFPACKWAEVAPHLPRQMEGLTALDIGCNGGFYSLELAARGARVTAVDVDERYLDQARWAAEVFGQSERVSFEKRQVYSLASDARRFDLILFMGVFYHLRYPLLALDILARLKPSRLIFQSLATADTAAQREPAEVADLGERRRLDERGWPKMAFVEGSLLGDPTNWWVPNLSGCQALLRSAGFRIVAVPGHEIFVCEPDPEHREDPLTIAQLTAALGEER